MIILSSRVLWSRLEKTVPSWMRQAKGKANTLDKAWVSTAPAWQEWPNMYSDLLFDSDCGWSLLTAGIFHPALGVSCPGPVRARYPCGPRESGARPTGA